MIEPQRYSFTAVTDAQGEVALRPLLPIRLTRNGQSIDAAGLLDTGADVNVLPYQIGVMLGAAWEEHRRLTDLSGNLAAYEARGIILQGVVGPLSSVRLIFAWTRSEIAPLILGQVNFFQEYDVCFYRSQGFFEVQPKQLRSSS